MVVLKVDSKRMKSRLRDAKSDLELFKLSLRQKDTSFLRAGTYHFSLPSTLTKKYQLLNSGRAAAVKRSMQHLWKGYRSRAFGHDELMPVSGGFNDNWGGVGLTLIDSLDTLWLLGFRSEFDEAVEWVVNNFTLNGQKDVSVFEYNIRLLGGLLSAYELSNNRGLLEKAIEVEMKAELYEFLLDNKYCHGIMFKKSMETFVEHYNMVELVEEESLIRGFQRWRKMMKGK